MPPTNVAEIYTRRNIFTIGTGAFPLISDSRPSYTQTINSRSRYHQRHIFKVNVANDIDVRPFQAVTLIGNHIFYYYSNVSDIGVPEGEVRPFLEKFFMSEKSRSRRRLNIMAQNMGAKIIRKAAKITRQFKPAKGAMAPEEADAASLAVTKSMKSVPQAKSVDVFDRYTNRFYQVTNMAANRYAYHHGIFGEQKERMLAQFRLNAVKYPGAKNKEKLDKANGRAVLNYYRMQVKNVFNPIIRATRKKVNDLSIDPIKDQATLASEMFRILPVIRAGADGRPMLSSLGNVVDNKASSEARGAMATHFIKTMLGNYSAYARESGGYGGLYYTFPLYKESLIEKVIIGQFATMKGHRFPELSRTLLKTSLVIGGMFASSTYAALEGNNLEIADEDLSRGHMFGVSLMGKTQRGFDRNEILNVAQSAVFTGRGNFRSVINLMAADKDFSIGIAKMLSALKTAGETLDMSLFQGGLGRVLDKTDEDIPHWAVPYLGIYDPEVSEAGAEV